MLINHNIMKICNRDVFIIYQKYVGNIINQFIKIIKNLFTCIQYMAQMFLSSIKKFKILI
jgi:hypothetical protein